MLLIILFGVKTKTLKDNNTFISVLSNGKEHIKGIDLLCEVTSSFPNCKFFSWN